jgi:pantoate--beta-alanine ligase
MILFKKAMPLSQRLERVRKSGRRIGFVPTMGALHEGHLALLQACRKASDIVACSIFVNPTQFNNPTDYKLYPNTIENDIERLIQAECHLLFLPSKEEMYPEGAVAKHYDLGFIETILEGKYRPGHFQGVCQAVDRLLEIVQPHQIYFGQKDYQQCMVVKKLLALTGRKDISLNIVPTERDAHGLALSSRNLRLTPEQRKQAVALYKVLTFSKAHIHQKSITELKCWGMDFLKSQGFDVDYFEIADAETLLPADTIQNKKVVGLIAAAIGGVRLIDNMLLN